MERELIEKLTGVFRTECEKIDVAFYELQAWNKYIRQYEEIFVIDSLWDLPEAVNHNDIFKNEPVAVPDVSGSMRILILPKDFAEKILAFGLPRDISEIVEEFKKKPVPRLGRRSNK